MSQAIILFAHGARDPEWAQPMQRLAEAVRLAEPGAAVHTAFLEFMAPDLVTAAEQAIQAGATTLIVVPVFLAQGGHVRRDVPLMLERIQAQHPSVRIELRAAIGEAQAVINVMAQVILDKV
ncbi:MAG TPA: CbiX/SirB N-terminal domain-containing protein [Rhodocyclaceae bacterium]|nr:CbiX/SirB N-terminal domain-containing protein [Rhodocyclaceae bacterium]